MKAHTCPNGRRSPRGRGDGRNARIYRAVILLVSAVCGAAATAQTNSPPQTNTPPVAPATPGSGLATNIVTLAPTTVVGRLDAARNQIVPDLGATTYTMSQAQIAALPQGENAPFNQVLLRVPGMAQDSAANGDLHLRGEHANIQYRINDVILPEGISGFGTELDTRFVDSFRLITGSLPAQYGFRTAGIVDLHTKSGAFQPGGSASLYTGSFDTVKPSFEYGGSSGNLNYFMDGSYEHTSLGIENTTPSATPVHDDSDQYRAFTYWSYVLDDTSRITAMASLSYITFQVPNSPGLPAAYPGSPFVIPSTFNSLYLNENQNEENAYGVVAYQKSLDNFNLQVAAFGRSSDVHFSPDPIGDMYLNGVASDVDRSLYSGGLQADASYALGEKHTLRGGVMVWEEGVISHTTTGVLPLTAGAPSGAPYFIGDNSVAHAIFAGIYAQDEWKILPQVTLNYGARFDEFYSTFDKENQPSPRVNLIYQPADGTTMHAGYARYFTPPPLENVPTTSVNKFNGTSNGSAVTTDDPVKAERANYFDVGLVQKILPGLQAGIDGYYKAAKEQLDDGLFGQTLILSAFNYAKGEVYGLEFPITYVNDGFSAYANIAYSCALGENWDSAQFLHDPDGLAYVKDHWIHLDHDQTVTGSFGTSYLWRRDDGSTRFFVDALYGTGLRQDATYNGTVIPNGGTVPAYYSVGLGVDEGIKIRNKERLHARFEIVNVTDNAYQLRSGSGVGVNAPQYGMRRGFFGTLTYSF